MKKKTKTINIISLEFKSIIDRHNKGDTVLFFRFINFFFHFYEQSRICQSCVWSFNYYKLFFSFQNNNKFFHKFFAVARTQKLYKFLAKRKKDSMSNKYILFFFIILSNGIVGFLNFTFCSSAVNYYRVFFFFLLIISFIFYHYYIFPLKN